MHGARARAMKIRNVCSIFLESLQTKVLSTLRETCLCLAVEEPHISIEVQEKGSFINTHASWAGALYVVSTKEVL